MKRMLALAGVLVLPAPVAAQELGACADADDDGVPDTLDVCPRTPDPDQTDLDADGAGAACDCDDTEPDYFPGAPDLVPDGFDQDCDGTPDDGTDTDGDGVEDAQDNCVFVPNAGQENQVAGPFGDACSTLQVLSHWPPPFCGGVPAGAPLIVQFNRPLDPDEADPPAPVRVYGRQHGELSVATDVSLGLGRLIVSLRETPFAGERLEVFVPPAYGNTRGHQWRFAAVAAAGTLEFTERVLVGSSSAQAVAIADMNGDDLPDLVLGASEADRHRVMIGDGTGRFPTVALGELLGTAIELALVDFDHDGDLDVASQRFDGALVLLLNNGSGNLVDAQRPPLVADGAALDAADFDQDDRTDLLVARHDLTGQPRVFAGVGQGFAALPGSGAKPAIAAHFSDFDADGDLDLLFGRNGPQGGFYALRSRLGAGLVDLDRVGPVTIHGHLDSDDLDGDGRPEVVVTGNAAATIYRFEADETWTNSPGPAVPDIRPVVLADVDGNGLPDAVFADNSAGRVRIFLNQGGSLEAVPLTLAPSGGDASDVAVADLDGDGMLDILVGGSQPSVFLQAPPDLCPNDPPKTEPGECGCDVPDVDADFDGTVDCFDVCPGIPDPGQEDLDGDGEGDACDSDADNDGVPAGPDTEPLDPTRCRDLDADACDDCAVGVDQLGPAPDANPALDGSDEDADGICDLSDFCLGPGVEPGCGLPPPDAFIEPPDAFIEPPDALNEPPDALIEPPDAFVEPPDAFVDPPDAAVRPPDALVERPDGPVAPPDVPVPPADGSMAPVDASEMPVDAAVTAIDGPVTSHDGPVAPPDASATGADAAVPPPDASGTGPDRSLTDRTAPPSDATLADAARADAAPDEPDAAPGSPLQGLSPRGGGGCHLTPAPTPLAPWLLPLLLLRRRRRPPAA